VVVSSLLLGCGGEADTPDPLGGMEATPRFGALRPVERWNSGTLYLLLIDRFRNGDPSNDPALDRVRESGELRGFEGGDLQGVLLALQEGWFDALGVTTIVLTPFVEQVAGQVGEGETATYGYHGDWARDWTRVDPAFGTESDLRAVLNAAHRRGIQVLMDVVINHPGPSTPRDAAWPETWIRNEPLCTDQDYATTVRCQLREGLPDLRTERNAPVELPGFLITKWEEEDRLEVEMAELEEFFDRTQYPRAPRYYVMKWLTDWVRDFGFDGFRIDAPERVEEEVSADLAREARAAFQEWKDGQGELPAADASFRVLGQVSGHGLADGPGFDYGDRSVDFYEYGYDALANFGFRERLGGDLDALYSDYSAAIREEPSAARSVVNFINTHRDPAPYDPQREASLEGGTWLLLAPGTAQINYGDEVARPLSADSAAGEARLHTPIDWARVDSTEQARVLEHWRTLARFRAAHPAVGAGAHLRLQSSPYVFARSLAAESGWKDQVVIALDAGSGSVRIPVGDVFAEGSLVRDAYSGRTGVVSQGAVRVDTRSGVVLLEASGRR